MISFIRYLGLAVGGFIAISSSAHAETYKMPRDFSYLNPTGVWAYGSGVTGASFTLFPALKSACDVAKKADCFTGGNAQVYINTSGGAYVDKASGTVLIGDNVIMMHPDTGVDAIIRFKAPRAGTYVFKGSYAIMDSSPTGVAPKIFVGATNLTKAAFKSAVDVVLTGPGADLAKKKPGQRKAFSFSRALKSGQLVYFGLNEAGNWTFDSTAFVVTAEIAAQ